MMLMMIMMMVLCHDGAKPNSILVVAVVVIVGCRRQSGKDSYADTRAFSRTCSTLYVNYLSPFIINPSLFTYTYTQTRILRIVSYRIVSYMSMLSAPKAMAHHRRHHGRRASPCAHDDAMRVLFAVDVLLVLRCGKMVWNLPTPWSSSFAAMTPRLPAKRTTTAQRLVGPRVVFVCVCDCVSFRAAVLCVLLCCVVVKLLGNRRRLR